MELYKIRNRISMGESIYDLPLKVTFYARVSTDKDVQLNSLDNQIMYFRNLITENKNWTYVDGYIDEGISGTSVNKREDFLRMVEDSKKGMFDLVLTKEISRFSRSTLDSIKYTQELLENNVGVIFQSDNINTIMPDSELRLTIMASIAQEEVRKLSERVKFGMKRSIEKGKVLGNNVITGYKKEKGKLSIVEKEAEMIRIIYEMYATGDHGLGYISDYLYEKGFKTRKKGYIHSTTLRRIITNPKYKGFYCTNTVKHLDYKTHKQIRLPQSEWIVYDSKGEIPAIVSPELWDKANELLAKKSSGYCSKIKDMGAFKRTTTYGGLLICAEHNVAFRRLTANNKTVSWKCGEMIRHGLNACESPILYESELDDIFHQIIDKLIEDRPKIIKHLSELYKEANNTKNYEYEINKVYKQIDEINLKKNKLLDFLIGEIVSKEEYKRRNNELEQEIENLNNKIIKLKSDELYEKQLREKYKEIDEKINDEIDSEESFQKLVQLLIERVVVSKIDGDRKKVRLDIYANVIGKKLSVYDKMVVDDSDSSLCSHKEDYDCSFSNRI
ncbi:MAG: recombinase family protein [bacterium]|nr:recombinase family protein [bacterium]